MRLESKALSQEKNGPLNGMKSLLHTKGSQLGALAALLIIFIVLSISTDRFLSQSNLTNVIRQAAVPLILAGGMTMILISGGLDLSAGSIVSVCSITVAIMIRNYNWPLYIAIPIVLVLSVVLGLINGLIVNLLKIPPMIATLATMISYGGIALLTTAGYNVIISRDNFLVTLGNGTLFGVIPYSLFLVLAIYLIISFVMKRTPFGRILYGMGGNAEAVRLSGINTNKYSIICYMLTALCAGFAAIVLTGRTVSGSPTGGTDLQMDAIAAAVLGGVSVSGGVGDIWGTVIGVFIMLFITNGLNLLSVNSYWQIICKGIVIILAIGLSGLQNNVASR